MRHASLRNLVIAIAMTGMCVAVSGALPAPGNTGPTNATADPVMAVHDQRLDLARASIVSAIALLKAAQNPLASNPDRPFGGHRTKAIRHLERSLVEIQAAMDYANQ
jgi:hypothetical protein